MAIMTITSFNEANLHCHRSIHGPADPKRLSWEWAKLLVHAKKLVMQGRTGTVSMTWKKQQRITVVEGWLSSPIYDDLFPKSNDSA